MRSKIYHVVIALLAVCSLSGQAFAQSLAVSGTVRGENGDPIAGVAVMVAGRSVGQVTDAAGKYTITATAADRLTFNCLGYAPQEIEVGGRTTIDVILNEDVESLDEIVVIGYGVQRKRDVTGSIASVKSEDIMARPTSNPLQALQGRVAGMDMNIESGQLTPNAGTRFTVRGNRSLKASNAPLILVDGIPYGDNLDLNSADIESIEVLKDASSTAIYGSRGANGVIIVTTKKGTEGKARVTLNAYAGPSYVTGWMKVFSGEEFVQYKTDSYTVPDFDAQTPTATVPSFETIFSSPGERDYIDKKYYTDWNDLIFHQGFIQNYDVSVSGGTRSSNVVMSLGYNDQKGLTLNENQRRYNFRIAGDQNIRPNLKVGINATYTYRDNNMRRDPTNMANKINPISRPYDDNGNFILFPAPGYTTQVSPIADEQPGIYKNEVVSQRIFANGYIDYNINKTWFFKTTFGINSTNYTYGLYQGRGSVDRPTSPNFAQMGHSSYPNRFNYTWENTINYVKTFGKHDLTVLAGSSTQYNRKQYYNAQGQGQPDPNSLWWYLASETGEITIASNETTDKLVSFFGRVNYSFAGKYLFSASIRSDGSSVLGDGNKWASFPSASVGWRIYEENFLKNAHWLSDLKLRASWGKSGNSSIDPYQTMSTITGVIYAYDESSNYGYWPNVMGNRNLRWEVTRTVNLGLDFSLLRGRISGAFDYYDSKTVDLLMPRALPRSSGYSDTMDNIGEVGNKGWELSLNTINTNPNGKFHWSTNFTFSHNDEKILSLASGVTKDEANGWFVGHPAKVYYDYQKLGIWQWDQKDEAKKNNQLPGDIRVYTANADGKVTADDRMILGNPRPELNFGMNNTMTFKGFDLAFFIYGKTGFMVQTDFASNFKPNALENSLKVDYWTVTNPTNAYPRPRQGTNSFLYGSTLGYVKGNFLKIRDITLGYTLPNSVVGKIGISKLRVYGTASNFFTFADKVFGDFDPERSISTTGPTFPMAKQVIFGINLNF
ncbi:MAG: TonB-dependent receptor [Rikenellaceae bacterium]|jgi:TonB-linked SusC/RagA family outer membrane protein|nr:TonB-dependent receptor [Rikenellaceae bacterium]